MSLKFIFDGFVAAIAIGLVGYIAINIIRFVL